MLCILWPKVKLDSLGIRMCRLSLKKNNLLKGYRAVSKNLRVIKEGSENINYKLSRIQAAPDFQVLSYPCSSSAVFLSPYFSFHMRYNDCVFASPNLRNSWLAALKSNPKLSREEEAGWLSVEHMSTLGPISSDQGKGPSTDMGVIDTL